MKIFNKPTTNFCHLLLLILLISFFVTEKVDGQLWITSYDNLDDKCSKDEYGYAVSSGIYNSETKTYSDPTKRIKVKGVINQVTGNYEPKLLLYVRKYPYETDNNIFDAIDEGGGTVKIFKKGIKPDGTETLDFCQQLPYTTNCGGMIQILFGENYECLPKPGETSSFVFQFWKTLNCQMELTGNIVGASGSEWEFVSYVDVFNNAGVHEGGFKQPSAGSTVYTNQPITFNIWTKALPQAQLTIKNVSTNIEYLVGTSDNNDIYVPNHVLGNSVPSGEYVLIVRDITPETSDFHSDVSWTSPFSIIVVNPNEEVTSATADDLVVESITPSDIMLNTSASIIVNVSNPTMNDWLGVEPIYLSMHDTNNGNSVIFYENFYEPILAGGSVSFSMSEFYDDQTYSVGSYSLLVSAIKDGKLLKLDESMIDIYQATPVYDIEPGNIYVSSKIQHHEPASFQANGIKNNSNVVVETILSIHKSDGTYIDDLVSELIPVGGTGSLSFNTPLIKSLPGHYILILKFFNAKTNSYVHLSEKDITILDASVFDATGSNITVFSDTEVMHFESIVIPEEKVGTYDMELVIKNELGDVVAKKIMDPMTVNSFSNTTGLSFELNTTLTDLNLDGYAQAGYNLKYTFTCVNEFGGVFECDTPPWEIQLFNENGDGSSPVGPRIVGLPGGMSVFNSISDSYKPGPRGINLEGEATFDSPKNFKVIASNDNLSNDNGNFFVFRLEDFTTSNSPEKDYLAWNKPGLANQIFCEIEEVTYENGLFMYTLIDTKDLIQEDINDTHFLIEWHERYLLNPQQIKAIINKDGLYRVRILNGTHSSDWRHIQVGKDYLNEWFDFDNIETTWDIPKEILVALTQVEMSEPFKAKGDTDFLHLNSSWLVKGLSTIADFVSGKIGGKVKKNDINSKVELQIHGLASILNHMYIKELNNEIPQLNFKQSTFPRQEIMSWYYPVHRLSYDTENINVDLIMRGNYGYRVLYQLMETFGTNLTLPPHVQFELEDNPNYVIFPYQYIYEDEKKKTITIDLKEKRSKPKLADNYGFLGIPDPYNCRWNKVTALFTVVDDIIPDDTEFQLQFGLNGIDPNNMTAVKGVLNATFDYTQIKNGEWLGPASCSALQGPYWEEGYIFASDGSIGFRVIEEHMVCDGDNDPKTIVSGPLYGTSKKIKYIGHTGIDIQLKEGGVFYAPFTGVVKYDNPQNKITIYHKIYDNDGNVVEDLPYRSVFYHASDCYLNSGDIITSDMLGDPFIISGSANHIHYQLERRNSSLVTDFNGGVESEWMKVDPIGFKRWTTDGATLVPSNWSRSIHAMPLQLESYSTSKISNYDVYSKKDDFTVYPNPTTGKLFVNSPSETRYQVISLLGKLLIHGELNEGINELNLKGLCTGTYLLKYESGEVNKVILTD